MSTLLKRGSKGAAVIELQRLLNAAGMKPRLNEQGDFGETTEKVVKAFQKKVGLVEDGKAGPQTMTAVKRATEKPTAGKAEPDKSAMTTPGWSLPAPAGKTAAAPPPNVGSLVLRDTVRKINEIIVHCAATPEGKDFTVADIRAWHKARGWSDIGYHYVVYRDGRVMEGRPVGQIGSHVSGRNTGTIGICYVGGVTADGKAAKDTRTAAQRASLLWLVATLAAKYAVVRISGHNEFANKACPSFDVPGDALGNVAGFARGKPAAAKPVPVLDAHPQPKAAFIGGAIGGVVLDVLGGKILDAVRREVADDNSPITRDKAPEIAGRIIEQVVPDVVGQIVETVRPQVEAVAENAGNKEPWYQSRVMWGSLVSIGALAAGLAGAQVDGTTQIDIVDGIVRGIEAVSTIIALGGSLYAIYGRLRGAKLKPLGK